MLASFPHLDAVGVAGDSRAMNVEELDTAMPALMTALHGIGASIVHYKVCSTFDSSLEVGNIGRVISIARSVFGNRYTPIIGGTPSLGRYCLFGNLFARSATDGKVYRIDRHPIMSVHPVTPMHEADLSQHIAQQTKLRIVNLDYPALDDDIAGTLAALEKLKAEAPDAILFDSATNAHLRRLAALLARDIDGNEPIFVVGGSGVEYALTQFWQENAPTTSSTSQYASFGPVDRLLVVSGSASRLSALQIDAAIQSGFVEIAVDPHSLLTTGEAAIGELIDRAIRELNSGRSLVLHTARGPDDPRIFAFRAAHGTSLATANRTLGDVLGKIAAQISEKVDLRRLVISGGDTSSRIVQQLAPDAIEIAARLAPGAPLCRLHAPARRLHGTEIALKGGQMGDRDYFELARAGRGHRI
jgi:uncharacterized protein YgbK (DUF1537 family)